jgi:hypothetical protein
VATLDKFLANLRIHVSSLTHPQWCGRFVCRAVQTVIDLRPLIFDADSGS